MSEEKNELIKVVDNIGLESQTSIYLKDKFLPFFEQAEGWKEKALELKVTDVSQTKEMALAREGRLALKQLRVEADKTRKALKEDSLRYGKAVQEVYNVIAGVIVPLEEYLEEQEKFAERQEQKRKAELTVKREEELMPYREFVAFGIDLGSMSDVDYAKILNGAKLQLQAKINEEQRIDSERIERERKEAEERERIRIENERLKMDAAIKQAELEIEREKVEKERKELAEKADKERREAEAKIKSERQAKEKLEAELKFKLDEELRIQREATERIEKENKAQKLAEKKAANAPDKTKLLDFAMKLEAMDLPAVKSDEATTINKEVNKLLVKVAVYIREQAKNL